MMLGFLACVWISSVLCGYVNGYLTELGGRSTEAPLPYFDAQNKMIK